MFKDLQIIYDIVITHYVMTINPVQKIDLVIYALFLRKYIYYSIL